MKALSRLLALTIAAGTLIAQSDGTRAQLLITGNDEKVSFDETGKTIRHAAGKDTVSIIDIRDPAKPRIVANLPLMNTITGPPVNLAITPDQHLALVANSLDWVKDGEDWKGVPDNKIYVIDLTTSPPAQIDTVEHRPSKGDGAFYRKVLSAPETLNPRRQRAIAPKNRVKNRTVDGPRESLRPSSLPSPGPDPEVRMPKLETLRQQTPS